LPDIPVAGVEDQDAVADDGDVFVARNLGGLYDDVVGQRDVVH
jgi:hypothetical protein